jgi:hypothetical protein
MDLTAEGAALGWGRFRKLKTTKTSIMKQALATLAAAVLTFHRLAAAEILVENFSFEQPGTAKIVGWNNIPGWSATGAVLDSGVESDWPGATHGVWAGFLFNRDPAIHNQTAHLIGPNDVFTMHVDAQNNWSSQAPAVLSIGFFYESAGNHIPLGTTSVNPGSPWSQFTFELDASTVPAAFGRPIGIQLQNITPAGDSWIGVDNVRLSVVPEPSVISLLGVAGALLIWSRRRARQT